MTSGHYGWKAIGGKVRLFETAEHGDFHPLKDIGPARASYHSED